MSFCHNCLLFKPIYRPAIKPVDIGLNFSSYTIQSTTMTKRGSCERKIDFIHPIYNISVIEKRYPWIKITCYELEKIPNEKLIVLYIKNTSPDGLNKKHKIIYCQNELSDLGTSLPFLIDVSTQTKTDIISFDYSGYGQSKGNCTIDNMLDNIKQVINFTIPTFNCPLNEIILFGDSIGTLCALYISMLSDYAHLKGIILLSPSFTGKETTKISSNCLGEIICPVLVIYGKKDDQMSIDRNSDLVKKLQFPFQWCPSKASHFDIPTLYRNKFYTRINNYIQFAVEYNRSTPESYGDYNEFSINLGEKLKTKRVMVINSYIKNSNDDCNDNELTIQNHTGKDNGKSSGIYVIETNHSNYKSNNATLKNNFPIINQKNVTYKNSNTRTESNGTFDLFAQ